MKLNINHIQHVGIPVTDLQLSIAFYERLGFQNVMSSTFIHEDKQGLVAMMKQGAIIMELYQMPEPALQEVRARNNGRIDHVAFDVADIDAVFKTLSENGFNILEQAPVYLNFWEKGCKYFNISGPDGERLEFNQIL